MGFLAGNAKAVKAFATVKDNTDSGQFRAIQKAAIHALRHPEITARTVEKYSRRMDLLVDALRGLGFSACKPGGSFYCYVRAPRAAGGRQFATAAEFSQFLIEQALVSTAPWDDAGSYVRFSVSCEAADVAMEERLGEEMRGRMESLRLEF